MKDLTAEGSEARASLLHGLLTRLGILLRRRNGDAHSLRETLEELIEEDEEEPREREFTDEERALLLNALSFGELQVWDVMVPRTDIKAIEAGASLAEVVGAMRDAAHTRRAGVAQGGHAGRPHDRGAVEVPGRSRRALRQDAVRRWHRRAGRRARGARGRHRLARIASACWSFGIEYTSMTRSASGSTSGSRTAI